MKRIVAGVIGITGLMCGVSAAAEPTEHYPEPAYFLSRPNPTADSHFGYVGVTG